MPHYFTVAEVQIFSISCSFWENLAQSYVGTSHGGLAPPPRGNPGSAPASHLERRSTKTFAGEQWNVLFKNRQVPTKKTPLFSHTPRTLCSSQGINKSCFDPALFACSKRIRAADAPGL